MLFIYVGFPFTANMTPDPLSKKILLTAAGSSLPRAKRAGAREIGCQGQLTIHEVDDLLCAANNKGSGSFLGIQACTIHLFGSLPKE